MINKIISLYDDGKYEKSTLNKMMLERLKNPGIRRNLAESIHVISLYMKTEEDRESYKKLISGMLEYEDLVDELKEKWLITMNNCNKGISLVEVFAQCPEIKMIMQQNVKKIIKYSNWDYFEELLNGIKSIDDDGAIIEKCILEEDFIGEAIGEGEEEILAQAILDCKGLKNKEKYIRHIIDKSERDAKIADIVSLCNNTEAQIIYDEHKGIMRLYHASKKSKSISTLRAPEEIIGEAIKKGVEHEINAVIDSCEDGENINITSHGEGLHSITYDINGKHLKIGSNINNFHIKRNHRRFLQPYIRKEINGMTIEVYETHDNNHDNITDEELLEVFEEIYRDGLVWEDAKKENLVRLTKDNVTPEFVIQRDDRVYGYEEHTEELEVLRKGEVAICDLDFIYSIDDPVYKSGRYKRGLVPPEIIALKRKLDKEFEEGKRGKNEGR